MRQFFVTLIGSTVLIASLLVGFVSSTAVATNERRVSSSLIAYRGGANMYVINADGTGRRRLISGVDDWWSFAWSPDAREIAFTKSAGGIYVAAADGTRVRPLVTGRMSDAGDSTWSPDGRQIAFAEGDGAIYTIHSDGTGLRRLTPHQENYYPAWSPDGRWILFERNQSAGRSQLLAIHPDGSGVRRIATLVTGEQCLCADWSPDGSKIAYQATKNPSSSHPEIFVMNSDGSGRTQLTHHRSRDENPDWSPDGTRIVFYSERWGNGEIVVMDANGRYVTRVTRDAWYASIPRWRPVP